MIRAVALLAALSLAAPAAAQEAGGLGETSALLAAADRSYDAAPTRETRLQALAAAVSAAEDGLAQMRQSLRDAAVRKTALQDEADAARDRAQEALGRLAARARAPLAAQAAQPAGPLAAARGAWLTAALGPSGAADAEAARARLSAALARDADRRAAWSRLRGALAALQAARADLSHDRAASPARDLAEARAALDAFAAVDAREPRPGLDAPPARRPEPPGALPLPVDGPVVTPWGAKDAIGQTVTGVEIAAPAWARPTAPATSTIRYAGPLAGRGQAVILEPAPGRLMILAGLASLSVQAGDIARAGVELGQLGVIPPASEEFLVEAGAAGGASSPQKLYLETREQGSPVDPARWFAFPEGRAGTP